MGIMRSGSQPSVKGPADWFIGTVQGDRYPSHLAVRVGR